MKLRTKFQDKDFELGEVTDVDITTTPNGRIEVYARTKRSTIVVKSYNSIPEFISEWEDAPEEPKGYWYINEYGTVIKADNYGRDNIYDMSRKDFGNYFETKEEAELVVRKLKAWQNIKKDLDKINWQPEEGDKFSIWGSFIPSSLLRDGVVLDGHREDLDLLIGRGEE